MDFGNFQDFLHSKVPILLTAVLVWRGWKCWKDSKWFELIGSVAFYLVLLDITTEKYLILALVRWFLKLFGVQI